MQKNKGLLDLGYDIKKIDLLLEILGDEIRDCTKQVRNIDLVLNNEVLLRQEKNSREWSQDVLTREKTNYLDRRKLCKQLVNDITGEEHYKNDELKEE